MPAKPQGTGPVSAIDDLLERGEAAKTRRDDAAQEVRAVVQALSGMDGIGYLDQSQKRRLGGLKRPAPRAAGTTRRRRRQKAS